MSVLLTKNEFVGVEFPQILPLLLFVNFMKDASGARLAIKHHKGVVKFFLVQSSLASVMTTAAMYYYSSGFPVALEQSFRVASGIALPFMLLASLVYVKDAPQIAVLRKQQSWAMDTVGDYFLGIIYYVLPLMVPLWLAINSSLITAFGGLQAKQALFQTFPATSAVLFSLGIVSVSMGSLGPAAGTLRKRRLIPAFVEQGLAVAFLLCFFVVATLMWSQSAGSLAAFINPVAALQIVKSCLPFTL
eukprot:TRINITY_DN2213_c0_g1_i2.p2 TRINITY_DN2213_c0_g1~~TRINITY_DN2213_c0_g1_i2.p2  ORF type:complete len:246 (+),score=41.76 TRINITY_DN2213_c0_g1_i2:198-935(+)